MMSKTMTLLARRRGVLDVRGVHRLPLLIALAFAPSACGGGTGDGGASLDGGGLDGSTGPGDAGGGDAGPRPMCEVPPSPAELHTYLMSGAYKSFPHESTRHPSAGPHGGNVQTYITPSLDMSLSSGAAEHPMCAASVKELYGSGATISGYAVAVKLAASSSGGANWYWYETYDPNSPTPSFGGDGLTLCTGCHAGGRDFVQSPYPLR
jgi:hypothetical protein